MIIKFKYLSINYQIICCWVQYFNTNFNTRQGNFIQLINGVIAQSLNLCLHQLSWVSPRLSFIRLYLFQMSKNGSQFIINLVKLPNGYAFQSFHQVDLAAAKKKSASKDKQKNPVNKAHRIFRQLALDPPPKEDLLIAIPEESEPVPRPPEPEVEEEYSVQIRREIEQFQCPAKWYDESSIHEIEKQSLPEFFNGRSYKTPGLYIKFRNFIVDLYRRNPSQYLTKIACRRILRGDVNTIMKIHTFLQKEGVINYCTSKQGNYNFSSSIFSRSLNKQTKSSLLIDKIGDQDEQKSTEGVDLTNITVTTVNKCFSKSNRVFCNKCQAICGVYWFKKKQETDKSNQTGTALCIDCFQQLKGSETEQYMRTDIIKKIQSGIQDNKSFWSIDDNLKLLHFVSKPSQKWQNLQSQFEKKKNFDDIMLQFMQFPIANFQPQKGKVSETAIEDPPQNHIKKLISRLSSVKHCENQKTEQIDPNFNEFTKPMVKMTKKLCEKLENNIKTNLQIESVIQSSLFEIASMKTISKKKIQDQEMLVREEKQKEFDENSEFNENEQEDNQHQAEREDHEELRGNEGEGEELQDIMDNLDYN